VSDHHLPCRDEVELARITSSGHPSFPDAECLYVQAFPPAERRDGLAACLSDTRFALEAISAGGAFSGFVTTWSLDGFAFLEHVATVPSARGTGIGRSALLQVLARHRLVVAEAEPADEGPMAVRRLAFYARLGFMENPGDYLQPSYGPGKPRVPMRLLSSPRLLGDGEHASVVAQLEREVYGVGVPARKPGSDAGAIGRPNR
jgi:GNAT superfamily N-acetyltransferase